MLLSLDYVQELVFFENDFLELNMLQSFLNAR